MPSSGAVGPSFTAARVATAAALAAVVAVLGALVTGRFAFAPGVILSAILAFWTVLIAVRAGREALVAGDAPRAGAVAGGMLAIRFLGTGLLMLVAFAAPRVIDLWGVVAGMAAVDVSLIVDGTLEVIAGVPQDPPGATS